MLDGVFSFVGGVCDCISVFLCLCVLSRWAVKSQESLSRSISPTSASMSTPTWWKSASSQRRERTHILTKHSGPCPSYGGLFHVSQNEEHADPQNIPSTSWFQNFSWDRKNWLLQIILWSEFCMDSDPHHYTVNCTWTSLCDVLHMDLLNHLNMFNYKHFF